MSQHLEEIKTAVVNGKHMEIEDLMRKAFADNMDLNSLINDSLIASMDIVGEKFSAWIRFMPCFG